MRTLFFLAFAAWVGGCGGAPVASSGPAKVDLPVSDGVPRTAKKAAPKRDAPPPSGTAREIALPPVTHAKLANGLAVDVVTVKGLPLVDVTLDLRAGRSFVGRLAALAMKDPDIAARIEALGGSLVVRETALSLTVTKNAIAEAVALLAKAALEPRFDDGEVRRIETRIGEDSASLGPWLALRELESAPPLSKVDAREMRAFAKKYFVPRGAALVFAGDIDEKTAQALAQKNFAAWSGGEPPALPPLQMPAKARVIVANRANAKDVSVFVAGLMPERHSPPARIALHTANASTFGRLFFLGGTTRSERGGELASKLETEFDAPKAATAKDVEASRRSLADGLAFRLETRADLADIAEAPEAFIAYRRDLLAADASAIGKAAAELFDPKNRIVVAVGDAAVLAKDLARFGDVTVYDADKPK